VDNLDKNHLITKGGATKGAYYQVNPTLLANAKSNIVTTLKTIEPYVLKALIKEDLHSHPMSKISEIASRIPDVDMKEIRKIIYTTNLIENLNGKIRKYTKSKLSFPSDDAVKKMVYLSLMEIEKKWTQPIHNWGLIMNQFMLMFENRIQI
jgi:transposase-like protein